MASTGTRPPLFGPDPGGFDDDVAEPRFPRRQSGAKGPKAPRPEGSSPAWVRPFILGGLVLVALISLVSVFAGDGDEEPSAAPTAAVAADPGVGTTPTVQTTADVIATPTAVAEASDAATPTPQTATPAPATAPVSAPAGTVAPELQRATAFAVQFAHDYLNYDQANPDVRQRELRVYLAPGLDPQLGWNGQGSQVAVLTVPVETRETEQGARVTVAAQVTGRDAPRWVHLAVDIARDDRGRLAVTRTPSFVPRPQPGVPAEAPAEALDQVLSDQLQPGMQPLFAAYAADPTVEVPGVTAADATIRGLGGQVALSSVGPLRVLAGDDATREAAIDVAWTDDVTGGTTTQSYTLQLAASGGAWEVVAITAG